jgi:hypothetical protein|tara:strand:- start:19874 stop:20110 length:237 start_codon:yes stop_codon:yes gene_type:complete
MLWVDYNIEQFGDNWTVKGDWPGEIMGLREDGTYKGNHLYKPGDVFVVQPNGVLQKTDDLYALIMKYEQSKLENKNTL